MSVPPADEPVLVRDERVSGGPMALRPAAGRVAADVVAIVGPGLVPERVELAVHEVLANAFEHGHLQASDEAIELTVCRIGSAAIVVVGDHALGGASDLAGSGAAWPTGAAGDDPWAARGRGLRLVRAVADEVDVHAQHDPPGTQVRLLWRRRGSGHDA